MTQIKICGIRTEAEIELLNAYLPEYAGFVMAETKRLVTHQQVRVLSSGLHKNIVPVGVFVNPTPRYVLAAVEAGIRVIQLHGDEDPKTVETLKEALVKHGFESIVLWKVFRVSETFEIRRFFEYCADAFLLDKYHSKHYGGTGEVFDWGLLPSASALKAAGISRPIFLAGGLSPANVAEAISRLGPSGVDVSSHVETDGFKDPQKVKAFIEVVRALE